jgi:hypothetical protein
MNKYSTYPSKRIKDDTPLYNTKIAKTYVEYLEKYYPEVNIKSILDYAGITTYQLDDGGYWLTQGQVNRFHKILSEKTKIPELPREVGRYVALSKASGPIRKLLFGFITPMAAYSLLENSYPQMSRSCILSTRNISSNKIEIIVKPKPGVIENASQCQNRIGMFEALARLFTNKFANIEHPTCIHTGGDHCCYIISWVDTPSFLWKKIRNYGILFSLLFGSVLFFFLPVTHWLLSVSFLLFLVMTIALHTEHIGKKELAETLKSEGDLASALIDQTNLRYNEALLIQEIGQATSSILDINELLKYAMETLEKRLDFDRGMIMLANKKRNRLIYTVGYGYNPELEEFMKKIDFHLDKPHSKGEFVVAFREQKPFLINDVKDIEMHLSKKTL